MAASSMFRGVCIVAFLATTFFQVFSFLFLPAYAAVPAIVYIGALGIFGLIAISRLSPHLLLIYLIGSPISEILAACSFGWTINWLVNICGYYDYYNGYSARCTPGYINAVISGLSFITYPLMFFSLVKLRKGLIARPVAQSVAPQPPSTNQGVFFTAPQPQPQQTQFFQAVTTQPIATQPVVLQAVTPTALGTQTSTQNQGTWH